MSIATGATAEGFALVLVLATILGFLAKRTGQPTLMAYILAGVMLGPMVFNIVSGNEVIELLSELGLAFLLFLIGMEIRFDEIADLLGPIIKISIPQMLLTASLGFGLAMFFGFGIVPAAIVGVAVMYGSTAVVVKLLTDKREHATPPGKLDIGVLLMQDIVVVILMAVLASSASSVGQLAITIAKVFVLLGVIGGITIASSRYILPTVFEALSEDLHIFLIHGIAWCFLFVSIAEYVNLSIEIGAFLAGLGIAQLPYSSELQERVRPLTDFFMALFFINFGLGLTLGSFTMYWKEALIASGVLIIGKFLIMFFLTDWQKFTPQTSFKTAVNMVQTSEFSLILAAVALSSGYITEAIVGFLSMIAITTMGLSAYVIQYNNMLYERAKPLLAWFESEDKVDVDMHVLEDHAVIVGYNSLAEHIVSVLEEYYADIVIIDRNPDNVSRLNSSQHHFIYGDIRHEDIREAARIPEADLVCSFVPDHVLSLKILDETREDARVFLRSQSMEEATELYEIGADYVIHKKILATSKLIRYLEEYLKNPDLFQEETEQDKEIIWWQTYYGEENR